MRKKIGRPPGSKNRAKEPAPGALKWTPLQEGRFHLNAIRRDGFRNVASYFKANPYLAVYGVQRIEATVALARMDDALGIFKQVAHEVMDDMNAKTARVLGVPYRRRRRIKRAI